MTTLLEKTIQLFRLLNFDDETAGQMKSYLFGRDSPDEDSRMLPEEDRADSPLGILEEGQEAKEVGILYFSVSIGSRREKEQKGTNDRFRTRKTSFPLLQALPRSGPSHRAPLLVDPFPVLLPRPSLLNQAHPRCPTCRPSSPWRMICPNWTTYSQNCHQSHNFKVKVRF